MRTYVKSSAGATRDAGGGTHLHLQHITDRSHHTRGTSASAVLAVFTYASEPQRCVRDFCVSLSDLSEVRLALNFPSRAGNL